jgi:hypothetical protein
MHFLYSLGFKLILLTFSIFVCTYIHYTHLDTCVFRQSQDILQPKLDTFAAEPSILLYFFLKQSVRFNTHGM